MLKYVGQPAITFAEFPDEISLCFNISNCPGTCINCSEPELRKDIGEELTEEKINLFISKHPGITLIGLLGGDADHMAVLELTKYIHSLGLKVGFYSGRNFINLELASQLDYYKIGEFRMFTGSVETWKDQTAGPICLPTSNQIMFKRDGNKLINITDKFRKVKINNWQKVIL